MRTMKRQVALNNGQGGRASGVLRREQVTVRCSGQVKLDFTMHGVHSTLCEKNDSRSLTSAPVQSRPDQMPPAPPPSATARISSLHDMTPKPKENVSSFRSLLYSTVYYCARISDNT
jgi:hypothetical protein